MTWQPIESAPKDGSQLLLWGTMDTHNEVRFNGPVAFSGYWDAIDGAWCGTASTWRGPFFTATHWMPLPEPPKEALMSMLERIARAIDTAMAEGANPDTKAGLEAVARAAVEAMREPPATPDAAITAITECVDDGGGEDAVVSISGSLSPRIWQVYIDAILNEKKSE